jgi:hypothetical protein
MCVGAQARGQSEDEASEQGVQLRVVWGGGAPRRWSGSIVIRGARLDDLKSLGLEADSPGAVWIESKTDGTAIEFQEPSPRVYDGVDFLVRARLDAVLQLEFRAAGPDDPPARFDVPLTDVLAGSHQSTLDKTGNRLVISRAPGDRLRVQPNRDSMVFRPSEVWRLTIVPNLPEFDANTQHQIKISLARAREGHVIWSDSADWTPGERQGFSSFASDEPFDAVAGAAEEAREDGAVRVDIPVPQEEGAYELTILASRLRLGRLVPAKPVAERRVQFVVVGDEAPPPPDLELTWNQEIEIDPASPGWLDRLRRWPVRPRIPWLMTTGPLGSGDAETATGPLGPRVRIKARSSSGDASWQAYPLPVRSVGTPHLLEVEYPADAAQELGISILEANSAGQVVPVSLDSGVLAQNEKQTETSGNMALHRLVFWPRTRSPLVLLSNRGTLGDAEFGKIRVLVANQHRLPPAGDRPSRDERLVAAYLERPLVAENFLASDLLDAGLGQGLDDWQTFYEGATRLVDYLLYAGHNGLMLSVMAEGSTIYPSELLQPTPKYDTGCLATNGMDPVRKDFLELLLRLFDREDLRLVPALQFSAPLPALEPLRRRSSAQESGLEWVDASGSAWSELRPSSAGLSAHYNPLHPQVQQAMLAVVDEIVEKYGRHASFHGLALQLTTPGYAHLPGPEWGMDDWTIGQFEADSGIDVPGSGPKRFRERSAFLLGEEKRRQAWVAWRSARLRDLHARMATALDKARPGLSLYLVASALFEDPDNRRRLKPVLPKRDRVVQALQEMGIEPKSYFDDGRIVFLRPQWIAAWQPLERRAVDMELNTAAELDRELASAARPGSLFLHRSEVQPLPTFDQLSPFGSDKTYTLLSPSFTPSLSDNRRRFAHSLAVLDSRLMIDGGSLLAMGQEDSTRPLFQVFRNLPVDCEKTTAIERQPITVRILETAQETWIYVVNDSPWDVTAVLPIACPPNCRREQVGPEREEMWTPAGGGAEWTVPLKAYDVAALRIFEPAVNVVDPRVELPEVVQSSLDKRIQDLNARMASLQDQSVLRVLRNPSFETGSGPRDMPGWEIGSLTALSQIERVQEASHEGLRSLKLSSQGPPATVRSAPFDTPRTGRLALYAWIRTSAGDHSPAVRLGLEGLDGGKAYYRFASIGGPEPAETALSEKWKQFAVAFNDLPVDQLQRVRLRLELMGPGTVWIDDVRLDRLYFDDAERRGLYKIVVSAGYQLKNGQLSDCQRLLEGYWPRFLVENVAITRPTVDADVVSADRADPVGTRSDKQPSLADRIKGLIPEFMRF